MKSTTVHEYSQIKVYDVIELASTIGHTFCKGLPFFYAFTGCDTVSSMYKCSKTHFWDELFKQPNIPQLLEVFAARWYCGEIFGESLLFQKGKHEFMNWWKSSSFQTTSFCQHQAASPFTTLIDWATIQGGWLWGECIANVQIPDVTEWGWQHGNEDEYVPRWQTVDETFTIDNVTQTCSCRKATCKSCKCAESGLVCLPFCGCEKSCEKWFVIHHYSVSFLFVMSYDVSLLLILYSLLIAAHFTFAWLFWYDMVWYWIENWFYFLVKSLQTIVIE